MAAPQDDIAQFSGDPIQQLFTTLGKFHRYLNKAQHAPDGDGWCDECMSELMTGLEISIACGWTPVKDALIDAARILHSYEKAGKAGLCVPFLHDSYELLSLMVGDLIVDKVRDGVKQKWREHYMRAIEEIEAQGITLVEDEEREVAENLATAPHTPSSASTEPPASESATNDRDASPGARPLDETTGTNDNEQHTEVEDMPAQSDDAGEHSHEDTPEIMSQKLAADLDNMDFDLSSMSTDFAVEGADNDTEGTGDIIPFPANQKEGKTPPHEAPESDSLEQHDLAKLDGAVPDQAEEAIPRETIREEDEHQPEDDIFAAAGMTESDATHPRQEEEQTPRENAGDRASESDDAPAEKQASAPPVSAAETAPARDASTEEEKTAAHNPSEDETPSETKATQTPEESADMDAPSPKESPDSPAALLQRVQQAITSGDARNTKAVALELAVSMARLEYEQARQELAVAEQKLLENGRVIEQCETKVAQKENELLQAEELLAARDSERGACREHIGAIDEEISAMTAELADIDAQIAALQQKRKEQLNRIENKQAEQEEAIDAESRAQTEMEALNQETETIREQLEQARNEARSQHAGRRAIELDIIRAQEEMESRRLSLAAIERTLNPNSDAPPVSEESDSLL